MSAVPNAGKQVTVSRGSRRNTDLQGIYEISKILCQPAALPRVLKSTLGVLDSFFDMSLGLIALFDEAGDAELVVGTHLSDADARLRLAAIPERAIGQIVVTHIPLVLENAAADESYGRWDTTLWGPPGTPPGTRFSFIGVPIDVQDRATGVLIVARTWHDRPNLHPGGEVDFLRMVANLIGQTLRLHEALARDRERLIEDQRNLEKARRHAHPAAQPADIAGIIGSSPTISAVVEKVRVAAQRDVTVLLRGESGTGKELFARALHNISHRRDKPFVTLNCAALPESVLESELFGHEKGAFTGAMSLRKGRFELADGGTLFLDEIGEISPAFQAKLLRVLQEGEFERVGGTRTLKVNVRLVAATNRNLEEAVTKGAFRADLYYRISVVPIVLPALRDRRGDIPQLADEFLRRFNRENATEIVLDASAHALLMQCNFPGNVRELENCIRRTATLVPGHRITDHDFACRNDVCLSALLWKPSAPLVTLPVAPAARPAEPAHAAADLPCDKADACAVALQGGKGERERLMDAMERTGWVQAKAARLLGLTPRQIGYALRKHDIPIRKL
ncbi:nif-specific transcriptional activator NifA [Roseomonas sp. NAR14]|uniref:Nif-specific regulatory protein n=1 Tax=Roseomonas acroporae TaxID=2937791 RepID=A0A9X2BVF7_9PROT|nr:nif-specific transcriptional activator NifA [Roseomonas acroporae]MCK8784976.1 nif-specific transcriptional activator NifA [Roseomonas acroporae]